MPSREQQADILRAAFEGAAHGVLVVAADGTVLAANDAHLRQLGRSRDEVVGHPADAVDPVVGLLADREGAELRTQGRRLTARRVATDGGPVLVVTSTADDGEAPGARSLRGRLARIVELTADLVASFGPDGACRWMNAAAARALEADARAPGDVGLAQIVDGRTLARVADEILPAVGRHGSWTGEVDLALAGRRLPLAATVLADEGDGWTLIGHDLTDHKALQAELAHLATHDELTGIPNRVLLAERLDRVDAGDDDLTVVFVDLDGFKAVNDTHGHLVGDLALIEVGRRLAGAVGPRGFVARFGGDEFVVLADPAWPDPAATVAAALDAPVAVGDLRLALRGGVGEARRRPGEAARDVVARADQAMYRAKAARRNPLHEALVRPVGQVSS